LQEGKSGQTVAAEKETACDKAMGKGVEGGKTMEGRGMRHGERGHSSKRKFLKNILFPAGNNWN